MQIFCYKFVPFSNICFDCLWLGLDLSDRIRDPASDSTLDSSTFDSEAESDYLEESGGNEKAENKCTKCGTWPNVVSRLGGARDKKIDF